MHTCNSNENCEAKADQEQHEHQDEMSFRQSVEPHGGQPEKEIHLELKHTQTFCSAQSIRDKQTCSIFAQC